MFEINNKSAWQDNPDYRMDIDRINEHIQVVFCDTIIADSRAALTLQEDDYQLVYYFPAQDVRLDLMKTTDKVTFCPYKGEATHWSIQVNDRRVEIAAWSYDHPFPEAIQIKNYIAFYPEVIEQIIRA